MTKTYTLSNGKEVKVTAKNKRVAKKFFNAEHYAYTIVVEVSGSDITYKTTFHDSVADYRSGKTNLDELIDNGIYCVILDADSYKANPKYEDFINEFGYDDNAEGRGVYNACKKTAEALAAMLTDDEIDSLYEEAYEKKHNG